MLARTITVLVLLAAAPPALAADDCFATSVGAWRGPVWNGSGLEVMETEFHAAVDGTLAGRYRIHDGVPFDGTLSGFHQTGTCEADFVWRWSTMNSNVEPGRQRLLAGPKIRLGQFSKSS